MPKFNRILSAMEATHSVKPPIVEAVDPIYVSDFIHHVFENVNDFGVDGLSKEWFCEYATRLPTRALSFVGGLLEEKGHIVSRKSLCEGITMFSMEETEDESSETNV